MRCSAVSIGKVDRLGKRSILTKIDRTGVERERGTVEEIGEYASVLCIPAAGRTISLLYRRICLPRGESKLIIQKDFQPEYPSAPCRLNGLLNRGCSQICGQEFKRTGRLERG